MGAGLIPLLQMGIWIIFAIMIGFVALYIYLMRPHNKNTYNSNNNKFEVEYNTNQYNENDDLNVNHEDDGPIQNL